MVIQLSGKTVYYPAAPRRETILIRKSAGFARSMVAFWSVAKN